MAIHWSWMRPKLESVIKEEIEQCRVTRACNPDGVLGHQLTAISEKIDGLSKEVKYVRERLDGHINHDT